jgi:hypothetical protein
VAPDPTAKQFLRFRHSFDKRAASDGSITVVNSVDNRFKPMQDQGWSCHAECEGSFKKAYQPPKFKKPIVIAKAKLDFQSLLTIAIVVQK